MKMLSKGWGGPTERIQRIADSAYFNFDGEDTAKCEESSLVVLQGPYSIEVGFKGAMTQHQEEEKNL